MRRARLLPRLAGLAVARAFVLCPILYFAGVLFPLLYPHFIRNTYISENALMPGVAEARFSFAEGRAALSIAKRVEASLRSGNGTASLEAELAAVAGAGAGGALEVYTQDFLLPWSVMSPLHGASGSDQSPPRCRNTVGVLRAGRGDGKESVVIVCPVGGTPQAPDATAVGLGVALLQVLGRSEWLAKDVVLLVPGADQKCLPIQGVESWLEVYHGGDARGRHPEFPRAGQIAAGIVLDMTAEPFREIQVLPEAYNGQLPNLDLINTAVAIAQRNELLPTALASEGSFWPTDDLDPAARAYSDRVGSALRFLSRSVTGAPTGAHAPFGSHMVSAVTLRTAAGPTAAGWRVHRLVEGPTGAAKIGRVLEGTVRSCSNLLERFHQSFFQYVLLSTNHFLSIDVYMAPLGLLLVCLPLHAAAHDMFGASARPPKAGAKPKTTKPGPEGRAEPGAEGHADPGPEGRAEPEPEGRPGDRAAARAVTTESAGPTSGAAYVRAVAAVCAAHAWGAGVAAAPLVLAWAGLRHPQLWLAAWVGWAALSWRGVTAACAGLRGPAGGGGAQGGWLELKVATSCAAGALLAAFAAANWALAYAGAALLVPLCLLARPLGRERAAVGAASSLALGSLASPPAWVAGLAWLSGEGVAAAAWDAVGEFAQTRTATYPFACGVYLPACALCWRIALWPAERA